MTVEFDEPIPAGSYAVRICVDDQCTDAQLSQPGRATVDDGLGEITLSAENLTYDKNSAFSEGVHRVEVRIVMADGQIFAEQAGNVVFTSECDRDVCASGHFEVSVASGDTD